MKEMTYESALRELQTLLDELQREQVSIDELQSKSERARELLDFCRRKLRDVAAATVKPGTADNTPNPST